MNKILFFILFLPTFIFAQSEWEHIATTVREDNYFIKNITKIDDYGKFSVWVKIQKSDKKEFFKGEKYFKPLDRVISKWDMDCKAKTTKTQTMVVYDSNGKTKESSNGPFQESFIIPDSIAEKVLIVACSKIQF